MDKPGTMSAAVMAVLDRYPAGFQFYGNQLKDDVARIHPESRDQYVDSILRMARRHRRGAFRIVRKNDSLYEKTATPGREAAPVIAVQETPRPKASERQLPLFGEPAI